MHTRSPGFQRTPHPPHDLRGTVFGDSPKYQPAHPLEQLQSPNIFDVLQPVNPMMVAVVFDSDHDVPPAQIKVGDRKTV